MANTGIPSKPQTNDLPESISSDEIARRIAAIPPVKQGKRVVNFKYPDEGVHEVRQDDGFLDID